MSDPSLRLKILIVGASGTLGQAVADELGQRHDIVQAGSRSGDVMLENTDPASIRSGLDKFGAVDAGCCAAGKVNFDPLAAIEASPFPDSSYGPGLVNPLTGQVNLASAARDHRREGDSLTFISENLADMAIPGKFFASMVCAAPEGFVRSSCELSLGMRLNLAGPIVSVELMDAHGPFFRGFDPVPVVRAAHALSHTVEGIETGQVHRVN